MKQHPMKRMKSRLILENPTTPEPITIAGPAGNPTQPPAWDENKRRWKDLSEDAKRLWLNHQEGKRPWNRECVVCGNKWQEDTPPSARQILGDIIIDLALRSLPPGLAQFATSRKVTITNALTLGWSACLTALKTEYTRLVVTEPGE